MYDNPEPVLQYLRWAATRCSVDFQPTDTLSAIELLMLFNNHRIAGRALEKIKLQRPAWAADDLVLGLEAQQTKNKALLKSQAESLRRFASEYLAGDNAVVLLKGLSCYLSNGNPACLRETLDLDLIARDSDDLVRRLRRDHVHEYRNVSPHELINATVCGADVDLHDHYPIWSPSIDAGEIVQETKGDITFCYHGGRLQIGKLSADILFESAAVATRLGAPKVFLADPAAAILINSAHCFRNYISRSSVSIRNKAPVRFAELVEISDYLDMDGFDSNRFRDIVARMNAAASVVWMGTLLHQYLGDSRLLDLVLKGDKAERDIAPPPISVWGSIWSSVRYGPKNYFYRHISTDEIAIQLGAPDRELSEEHPLVMDFSDLRGPCGLRAAATIHGCSKLDETIPIKLWIAKSGSSIMCEIHVNSYKVQVNQRICVDINGYAFEWNWNLETERTTWKHSDPAVTPAVEWARTSGGYKVKLSMQIAQSALFKQRRLPVLVGAGEFERDHVMHTGVLVPVVVHLRG